MHYLPQIHIKVPQIILCIISLMYVGTIHCISYTGQESKTTEAAVLGFLHTCDLETGQGHQPRYELADPKQVYSQARFERPCPNSVRVS